MREMKNTGVVWCPYIPTTWHIDRVKNYFNISKDISTLENPTVLKLARSGICVKDVTTNEGQMAESYDNYNKVKIGDLLLNPMDLYSGANCNVSEVEGVISPAYTNLRAKRKLNPKFFDYYFKVQYWAMAMFAHGKGVSFDNRWTINAEGVKNYEIPIPLFEEQNCIVEAINRDCAKVDALIANQEAQIEKLKQYKQSLITEVVTKGLNHDVPMKDSGIWWIGRIPFHWSLGRVKEYIKIENGSDPKLAGEIPVYGSGSGSFKTCGEYKNGPTVLLGRKGATLHIPHYIDGKYWNADTAFNTIPTGGLELKLFFYVAHCFDYQFYKSQTTLPGMTQTAYSNMVIPIPPKPEQEEIVLYLDKKWNQVDHLITKKQAKIDKLNEYKMSFIYEYVTGKKEVKN